MKKAIGLILLIFILSISFVNASENITDINENPTLCESKDILSSDNPLSDVKKVYVNSSKETSGDGSSWENATNKVNIKEGDIFYLAEGKYGGFSYTKNYTIVGYNENTIITSLWSYTSSYRNFNVEITFINVTFNVSSADMYSFMTGNDKEGLKSTQIFNSISLDGRDFNFINCTFLDTSIVSGQNQYANPNKDGLTDICTANFENCKFLNRDYDPNIEEWDVTTSTGNLLHFIKYESRSLITSYPFTKYSFNNCIFDNITSDVIIDSYGGQSDDYGRFDGVYIYNSIFNNCTITSIVKARQLSYCEIIDCTYDFDVSEDVGLVSPFYINKTKKTELSETQLSVTTKDNSIIITLTDVNANKPISNVEVGIFRDGKVFKYEDTDANGQIILKDLEGTYNFEISYPGDPYSYLPASINKTFTFVKNEVKKEDTTTKKVTKKAATKITAKAKTFKVKKTKKYSITLKSGKKALSKVKVTIKVGKKTYSAKTNSKGKATFNLKKLTKKGKYTAVIKFNGNKYYKATTKKVKITVKK